MIELGDHRPAKSGLYVTWVRIPAFPLMWYTKFMKVITQPYQNTEDTFT